MFQCNDDDFFLNGSYTMCL